MHSELQRCLSIKSKQKFKDLQKNWSNGQCIGFRIFVLINNMRMNFFFVITAMEVIVNKLYFMIFHNSYQRLPKQDTIWVFTYKSATPPLKDTYFRRCIEVFRATGFTFFLERPDSHSSSLSSWAGPAQAGGSARRTPPG